MWHHHRVRFTLRDHRWPALLMVCLLHWPLSTAALGETRHVLVLSSSERPHAPQSGFTDALVRELIRSSREPIQFVEIPVQAARASAEAPGVSTARQIRSTVGANTLDLVMTIGGPAATFAQQFRQELFAATPVLIAGVDRRFVENGTFTNNETTVATQHDPAMMIDEILRLLPETRTVMVVVGASQVEQFWLKALPDVLFTLADVCCRVVDLPRDAARHAALLPAVSRVMPAGTSASCRTCKSPSAVLRVPWA